MSRDQHSDTSLANLKAMAKLLDDYVFRHESEDMAKRIGSMSTAERAQYLARAASLDEGAPQNIVNLGSASKKQAEHQRQLSAHLDAMAQRVSAVLSVFLFGTNSNVAMADVGRRRASQLPSVTWVQEGIEVTIAAGINAGKVLEVALSLGSPPAREPRAISWADPKTLRDDRIVVERFDIHRDHDGRYLIAIKKPQLEQRLAAISKAKKEGHVDRAIVLSPLVEFD